MSLTLSYEDKRDLLTGMSYKRGNTGVASRTYTYDAAGRPITRNTSLPFSHIAATRFEYDAMGNEALAPAGYAPKTKVTEKYHHIGNTSTKT